MVVEEEGCRQRWLLLDGTAPVKVVLTIMSASKASQLLYGGWNSLTICWGFTPCANLTCILIDMEQPVCPCSMRWSLWPRSIFSRVRSPTKFVQIRKYILREMYGCTKTTRINLSCGIHFSGKAWSPCPIEFLPVSIPNTIDASNEEKPVKILALGKFVINLTCGLIFGLVTSE